jgi:type II secretory pathway predicted ATPase ExeA
MYESYWGFSFSPFQNVPDSKLYFASSQHEEALSRLMYVIKGRKGAALLTGEVGSGKTTLSWILTNRLGTNSYNIGIINNPALSPLDFLREVMYQTGASAGTSSRQTKLSLLHSFNDFLYENQKAGKETVVIVDEAQIISKVGIFEELRLLLNFHMNDRFLLTLILIGQPELRDKVARVRQLSQRIATRYHLGPFSKDETAKYIGFKLKAAGGSEDVFSPEAVEEMYKVTGGIPRVINNVSDFALLEGFGKRAKAVTPEMVGVAAREVMA